MTGCRRKLAILSEYSLATKAEDKFIVRVYSDRSLGAYYIYDKTADKLTKIADIGPWLKEDELARMNPIEYKSRDGLTIHGYLTLPNGTPWKRQKTCRFVVNPHGGPWARDSWDQPEYNSLQTAAIAVSR